ncbi:Vps62-related protein [Burkholderia sp. F1]|uniref:Vps62-related protein n=1 Tax=Burkholderia sp. F1 TaxID=3366817 RepID=UPI003D71DCE9
MDNIYLISQAISAFSSNQVTDVGSGADSAISFWSPQVPFGWGMLGMTATPNYNAPPSVTQNVYRCSGAGGVSTPSALLKVWTCSGHHQSSNLGIYMPMAPNGFIALGCVAVMDFKEPPSLGDFPALICVRQDLCEQVTLSNDTDLVWTDKDSKAPNNVSVWMLPTARTCVATVQRDGYPSKVSVWDIKKASMSL